MYPFLASLQDQGKKTNEDYATDEKLPGNFNRDTLLQKEMPAEKTVHTQSDSEND